MHIHDYEIFQIKPNCPQYVWSVTEESNVVVNDKAPSTYTDKSKDYFYMNIIMSFL